MKRKQLYALGLAVSIASSAMAGSTMSVAAMDDSMDTAIVQETAETPDDSVTGGGEVETEENLPAEGDASIEENVSAGESASIEENISTEGNTTIEGSITADNAVAAENAPVKEETNKASTGMKPSTTYAVVDKSELEEEIQRAELVEENQSWYTPDSYAPVESALQVARAVMNNDSATEAEVTAAIQNLRTAQSGLVLTAQGLLDYVESQISGPMSYTPESWDAYQAEKAKVEAVIADPGAYTEPQWQQIAADYQEAYRKLAMLPSLTDKAGLETLIGRAQSVVNNASWYDPASVTAVQNLLNSIGVQPGDNEVAVSEAVKDLDSYETEQMMNQIMNTLNTVLVSQEGLIQLADELAAQIQQLENTGYYDTTELQSLATKVANAKNVFEAATSTTDQINGAVQDLSDVQDALDTIKMSAADVKNKLAALVGESAYAGLRTAIEAGDNTYTENSKAFFKDSYDTAKALVDSTDMAEPEEYLNAYNQLKTAMDKLVTTEDAFQEAKDDLDKFIEQEKDTVGEPGGISKEYMDKLTEMQTKFETALNETPNDVDILSPLVEEAGALIAKANMNRVSQPVTPESPEPEKETVVVKEKTTVLTNNKKTKKTAKTPQTGDPVSATALLLMLGASAGVIGKMKKKKEE